MEVFNRLTTAQIEKLLELEHQKIMEIMSENRNVDYEYQVDFDFDELEVEFLLWNKALYVHCIFVSTFGVDVIFQNEKAATYGELYLIENEIKKVYLRYMYSVFGEEFKTEYLAHVAKVFEEE